MNTKEIVLKNDVPLKEGIYFSAGLFSCLYESGSIRYILYDEREVIRMVYPTLRDGQWHTVAPAIKDEVIQKYSDRVLISYTAGYEANGIRYEAQISVQITPDKLIFEMKGRALSSFKSKRIGICVLHPILPCAGMPVEIIKPGGKVENSKFPVLISGSRPFTDVTGMRWRTAHKL
jgi:hypothetical protein